MYKSEKKNCFKSTKTGSPEEVECVNEAYRNKVKTEKEAKAAGNDLNKMCDFQKPKTPRDSIKRFEEVMRIY